MKTTLMKTTWWCLASPGAAPRAVAADSRENEPRRQVWMYGTLVERASTPRERVHRWLTPLKDVPGGKARRGRPKLWVDQSPSERPWGRKSSGLLSQRDRNGRFVRERVPVSFRLQRFRSFRMDRQAGRESECPASAAEVVAGAETRMSLV